MSLKTKVAISMLSVSKTKPHKNPDFVLIIGKNRHVQCILRLMGENTKTMLEFICLVYKLYYKLMFCYFNVFYMLKIGSDYGTIIRLMLSVCCDSVITYN